MKERSHDEEAKKRKKRRKIETMTVIRVVTMILTMLTIMVTTMTIRLVMTLPSEEAGHGPPSAMAVQCRERNANPKFNFRRHLQRGNPPPNTRRLQPVADKKVLVLKRPQVSEIIITITVEE